MNRGKIFILESDATDWIQDITTPINEFDPINLGHVTQSNSNATGILIGHPVSQIVYIYLQKNEALRDKIHDIVLNDKTDLEDLLDNE